MIKKIKIQINLILYTIKMIIKINKKVFFLVTLLSSISGIFPLISLKITQNILNTIQSMQRPFNELVNLIVVYFFFLICGLILQNVSSYFMNQLNIILTYNISYLFMEKCSNLSLETLENTDTYDKISRLQDQVSIKPFQALQSLINLCSNLITFLGALLLIFSWKKWLFGLFIITSFVFFIYYLKIGDKEFQMKFNRSNKEREAWYYTYLLTHDTAFKEIKVLNLKEYFLKKYWTLVKSFISQENRINKLKILFNFVISGVQDILTVGIMFFAVKEAYFAKIFIGTALVYINLTSMIQSSISSLAGNIYSIYNSNLYMKLLKDFLCLKIRKKIGKYKITEVSNLKVKNVCFDYPNKKNILRNISFEVKKGECVAIVGKNGSGKSTLLKLLCGLYEVNNGCIEINGQNINEIDIESYKAQISVLFQDFLKFEGSLLENIHIGNIGNPLNKKDIKESLDFADVDFLKENDEYCYNKFIGNWFEDGSQLSGGQWQKIALARTYYKKASVYFLDEPSSALDVMAEMKVFNSFFKRINNNIGIYITHRVKIAKKADKIIVLNNGRIIDIGNHEYLYKNCLLYKELYLQEQKIN
ncbi:ABC transporter ATP-binding protein [Clostridium tyrobutyricum]|uniref:ABC transporter ATP-binding protein n=1 Tax=Clostridium tyrobutyricum TaxID=1519 RepID=UPI001C3C5B89|nr:ABC transporter ATP-binding protein [Clostridium tyrobutyricum]MBV4438645.1 ABC transporter ATP-binding protein/permease [Clostridium tyrobutyricum]